MKFSYTMFGRSGGPPAKYEGTVDTTTPKLAILSALVQEFGDPKPGAVSVSDLTKDGWMEPDEFQEQFDELKDDDRSFLLDAGDMTFDVFVEQAH